MLTQLDTDFGFLLPRRQALAAHDPCGFASSSLPVRNRNWTLAILACGIYFKSWWELRFWVEDKDWQSCSHTVKTLGTSSVSL
jgi:hypothetical protein